MATPRVTDMRSRRLSVHIVGSGELTLDYEYLHEFEAKIAKGPVPTDYTKKSKICFNAISLYRRRIHLSTPRCCFHEGG